MVTMASNQPVPVCAVLCCAVSWIVCEGAECRYRTAIDEVDEVGWIMCCN